MPITIENPTLTVTAPLVRSARRSWVSSDVGYLESGHYLPSRSTLRILAPRPAAEIASNSVYNKWVPTTTWRVPLLARGGSYPYQWSIVSAPEGVTVDGTFAWSTKEAHGTLQWATPTAGDHVIVVRCVDQELNTAVVTIELNVAESNGVWVDADNISSGARDGSRADPWGSIAEMYAGKQSPSAAEIDYSDTTHADKILILAAGTYTVPEANGASSVLQLGANKPKNWIGDPDVARTAVVLDISSAYLSWNQGTPDDIALMHLTLDGSATTAANPRAAAFNNTRNRATFWDLTISDYAGGSSNTDNPDAIYCADSGAGQERNYICAANIEFVNLGDTGNGGGVKFMNCYNTLMQWIHVEDCTGADSLCQYKHDTGSATMRGISAVNCAMGKGGWSAPGSQAGTISVECEFEYCLHINDDDPTSPENLHAIEFADDSDDSDTIDIDIRRCTVVGGRTTQIRMVSDVAGGAVELDDLVLQGSPSTARLSISDSVTLTDADDHLEGASGIVDSDGLLTGSSRTSSLGLKGWEIV